MSKCFTIANIAKSFRKRFYFELHVSKQIESRDNITQLTQLRNLQITNKQHKNVLEIKNDLLTHIETA